MKAPMLLALAALSTAQAAEPTGTLTLACEGQMKFQSEDTKPTLMPLSFGVIVDFTNRTVQGLPSHAEAKVKVNRVNETGIIFGGEDIDLKWSIQGKIDRVTGDLRATDKSRYTTTEYSLKCKPTQRMF
jgi:hypothetical protein